MAPPRTPATNVNEGRGTPTSSRGLREQTERDLAESVRQLRAANAGQQLAVDATGGDGSAIFSVVGSPDGVYSLQVASAVLDFETKSSYTLQVTAKDTGTGALTATTSMVVQVADVNEPPELTSGQVRTIPENSPVYTMVGDALAGGLDAVRASGPRFSSILVDIPAAYEAAAGAPASFYQQLLGLGAPHASLVGYTRVHAHALRMHAPCMHTAPTAPSA